MRSRDFARSPGSGKTAAHLTQSPRSATRTPGRSELFFLRLFTVVAAVFSLGTLAVAAALAVVGHDARTLAPGLAAGTPGVAPDPVPGVALDLAIGATAATTAEVASDVATGALWVLIASHAVLLIAGLIAPWAGAATLRITTGIGAFLYLAGLVAMVLPEFMRGGLEVQPSFESQSGLADISGLADPSGSRVPWIMTAAAAAIVAGLVSQGLVAAAVVLIASFAATLTLRLLAGELSLTTIVNDGGALMTGVIVGVIGALVIGLGRTLDERARELLTATERSSAARGRLAARRSTEALTHDEVLATLAFAGSGLPVPRDRIATQAAHALQLIDQHTSGEAWGEARAAEAVKIVVEDATRLAPHAHIRSTTPPEHARDIPGVALAALRTAAQQALTNSLTHAAPDAHREVTIDSSPQGMRVIVRDSGPGFDPAAIDERRLGLRTSIVQRMLAVGGSAHVKSSVPGGTSVRLEWGSQPSQPAPGQPAAHLTAQTDLAKLYGFGVAAIALTFVCTQLAAAGWAASITAHWWAPLAVVFLYFVASEILRFSPEPKPGPRRSAVTLAVIGVAVALASWAAPFSFGEQWFMTTAAFVLTTFAFRERIAVSVIAGAVLVAWIVALGTLHGQHLGQIALVAARPVIVLSLTAGLALAVAALQRRVTALNVLTAAEHEQASWAAASLDELTVRGSELRDLVRPVLEQLADAGDAEVSDDGAGGDVGGGVGGGGGHADIGGISAVLRSECLALEGRLRDQIRAGRLGEPPLAEAVRDARARGVDVVLLDDREAELPVDTDWVSVLEELANRVRQARQRVHVRLLPEGREELVTCVVDDS